MNNKDKKFNLQLRINSASSKLVTIFNRIFNGLSVNSLNSHKNKTCFEGDHNIQHNQSGLTLIELMVVIVILGILAALIIPNLLGNTEKANQQKAISDITALENALEMYRLDNQRYPTTEQGLNALVEKPSAEPLPKSFREDGYIRRLPDDPWGNPYVLASPGENSRLDIFSFGPDGEPKTADDIGNWNLGDFQ